MNAMKEITTKELTENPFKMIGQDWLLVTAKRGDQVNTMTASWGGVGVMWGKDVAYVVIRPQRYTKEFIDQSETFSLTVLPDGHKDIYSYLGKVSGRDEDKIAKAGLTIAEADGTPYFAEGKTVLICKKLFVQPFTPDSFLDPAILDRWYPEKDYHTLYICEIQKVLTSK